MSLRLNRRRSSSLNSNSLLSTLKRRTSITANDFDQVQILLQKRKKLTTPFIFMIITGTPVFIFSYQIMLFHKEPLGEVLSKELSVAEMSAQLYHTFLSPISWLAILLLAQFQLLFLWCLPAEDQVVVTTSGAKYYTKHSSFDSCVLICLLYMLGSSIGLYPGEAIYANWIGIMFVLSLFSIVLQIFLFSFYSQDSPPIGPMNGSGEPSFISEVFFGRHLQPVIFGVDVKMFITNRIMLTLWSLYIISAIYNHKKVFGKLSASLITCSTMQFIYVARRQWFEYMTKNLDNANDRMGFYRIWGVLVFLPTIYLTPITLLSQTKESASVLLCSALCVVCLLFQYLNTDIDLQKCRFRAANGQLKISNKDPYYITAKYRREGGDAATELLLGSGYWGKARHLNYTTEFLTYLTWSLTTKLISFANYFPVLFLAILLYGRMQRDEMRCLVKYTYHWLKYISKVPYLIVPGVY